jgi:hypothetical protein
MQKAPPRPKNLPSRRTPTWAQKNAEPHADPKFVDAGPNKCPPKKPEPKNVANFEYFRFCAFFRGFFAFNFC